MTTTEVCLAYGTEGLVTSLPTAVTTVIAPRYVPAADDPNELLRSALTAPVAGPRLRDLVRPGQRIAVSVCDVTRPQPRRQMLEALLDELAGIAEADDVVILIATGTHRGCTPSELEAMLGPALLSQCEVVNHDGRDQAQLVDLGVHGDGVPVRLQRRWVEADVRITTGFVEPHFFAGFSGGPKMVAPGLAGLETVLTLHDAHRIGDANATWGICEGNPVHDDVRAIAAATGVDFAFDVVLNREQRITHAYAGELFAMHAAARTTSRELAMQPVNGTFDIVVTTNAGYPLDQNLYQSVKGMTAASNIVQPGGLIICATACADGLPDHGSYGALLRSQASPAALLEEIERRAWTEPDQWQVQLQARVQQRARVKVRTDGLDPDELRAAHLEPCEDIAREVAAELRRAGPDARVCVLPEGPQTIPYLVATGT